VKYLAALFVSISFAAVVAVGVSAADPQPAEAAGGGEVARCGGGKIFLRAPEKELFSLHNRERTERGLPRLCVHPALLRAAEAHSEDMIRRDYFSHDTKGRNESACERIRRYGYRYRYCGENIGYNSSSPERMFAAWMNSSGHKANILNGKFREVGIGVYTGDYKGDRITMHTVDFGTRF
jgi:uncharacterized protein YkwD